MKKIYLFLVLFVMFVIFAADDVFAQTGWVDDGTVVRLETSTDKVGIGTAQPESLLTLDSGSTAYLTMRSGAALRMRPANNLYNWDIQAIGNDLQFLSGGTTPRLYLQFGGNVGIGTTNPSVSLHNNGDFITKGPWIDVRAYASFSDAIDNIGVSEKTLLIPNQQTVSVNKTVPSNVNLLFTKGGYLDISANVTVTINGPIDAGLWQIFYGTGSVSFGSISVKEVYPEWWGNNTAPGTTDMTSAVQSALNAHHTYFSETTYLVGNLTISNSHNIRGEGRNKSILKAKSGTTALLTISASDITIDGIEFDGNSIATQCIDGNNIDRPIIKNCYFHHAITQMVRLMSYTGIHVGAKVLDCEMGPKSGGGIVAAVQLEGYWPSWPTGGKWSDCKVERVYVNNCDAIFFIAVQKSSVSNCQVYGGADIGIDAEYCDNIRYENNYTENNFNHGITLLQYVTNSIVVGNTCYNNGAGIYIGETCTDNQIVGNKVTDGAAGTNGSIVALGARSSIVGNHVDSTGGTATSNSIILRANSTKCLVEGNIVRARTGNQGVVVDRSDNCQIVGNLLEGGGNGVFIYGENGNNATGNAVIGNYFVGQSSNSLNEVATTYVSGTIFLSNYSKDVDDSCLNNTEIKGGNFGKVKLKTISNPGVPLSNTAYTNNFGVDCMVYITGGTVTVIKIAGITTGLKGGSFLVPNGQTITITYSIAPTWTWIAND